MVKMIRDMIKYLAQEIYDSHVFITWSTKEVKA